jgi:hypothetical protein
VRAAPDSGTEEATDGERERAVAETTAEAEFGPEAGASAAASEPAQAVTSEPVGDSQPEAPADAQRSGSTASAGGEFGP